MGMVTFMPWIGPEYSKVVRGFKKQPGGYEADFPDVYSWGTKHRILMLGASPYLWKKQAPTLQFDVINQEHDFYIYQIKDGLVSAQSRKPFANAGLSSQEHILKACRYITSWRLPISIRNS